MPSPEHKFQPHTVFAPDNKPGDITNDPELEPRQASPLVEFSSTTNQHLKAFKLYASAVLGFTHEQVSTNLEGSQSLPSMQSITIDADQIRAKRREWFEQTGYVPLIAGGMADNHAVTVKLANNNYPKDLNIEGERVESNEVKVSGGSSVIGRYDFDWTQDLSANAQKLYLLLLDDIGLTKYLPELAKKENFNLETALEELRSHKILDASS